MFAGLIEISGKTEKKANKGRNKTEMFACIKNINNLKEGCYVIK